MSPEKFREMLNAKLNVQYVECKIAINLASKKARIKNELEWLNYFLLEPANVFGLPRTDKGMNNHNYMPSFGHSYSQQTWCHVLVSRNEKVHKAIKM